MTVRQYLDRQAAMAVGYAPAEASFTDGRGEVTLLRQNDGSWLAVSVHDPTLDGTLFLEWETALARLRMCGYQVPAPADAQTAAKPAAKVTGFRV